MLKLNEKFFSELQKEIDANEGIVPAPADWRKTEILKWKGGIIADVARLDSSAGSEWWKRPQSEAEKLDHLLTTLRPARDGAEEENVHVGERVTAEEVARVQRDKAKRRREGDDEEEEPETSWEKLLGRPRDDARTWLRDLSARIDMNGEGRGFFGALKDHVESKPRGATCGDLNAKLVEFCLRQLCSSSEE